MYYWNKFHNIKYQHKFNNREYILIFMFFKLFSPFVWFHTLWLWTLPSASPSPACTHWYVTAIDWLLFVFVLDTSRWLLLITRTKFLKYLPDSFHKATSLQSVVWNTVGPRNTVVQEKKNRQMNGELKQSIVKSHHTKFCMHHLLHVSEGQVS